MKTLTAYCVAICWIALISPATGRIVIGQHLESYVATGAGDATYNGNYYPDGTTTQGDLRWSNGTRYLVWTCTGFLPVFEFSDNQDFQCLQLAAYWIGSASEPPPSTGWLLGSGTDPAPQVDVLTLPVEVVDFYAIADGASVVLTWRTIGESPNMTFEVEQHMATGFSCLGSVEGDGDSREYGEYDYTVSNLEAGAHAFRLRTIDSGGASTYSDEIEISVAVPSRFGLRPAYPNPFNPSSTLSFDVPQDGEIHLAVYNMLGQTVSVLRSGYVTAGMHSVTFESHELPSGMYFARLETMSGAFVRQLVLSR